MTRKTPWIWAVCCICMLNLNAAYAFDAQGVDIHGYISQGYMKTDDNNYLANTEDGTFEFTEVGINVSKDFDKLRIGLQLVSRDLGEFGNNEIELDWAVGDYRFNDYIGLRAGKIKMPSGFYNQERDLDMLRTPVFLPASVYDEGSRDMNNTVQGAGAYGSIDARAAGEIEYELFYGGTNIEENSAFIKGLNSKMGADDSDISVEYVIGGALRWNTPIEGLRLGGSYRNAVGDVNLTLTNGMDMNLEVTENAFWVLSTEYTWHDLILSAEYGQNKTSMILPGIPETSTTSLGWYVQASYQINDWLTAGVYYSEYYPNKDDKDGNNEVAMGNPDYYAWQKEVVPTLRFDVGYNIILKAEAHFVNGTAQVYGFNNPGGQEKDWNMYVLKATFSF